MIFEYGKPISEKLSEYLKQYTAKHEIIEAGILTGLSTSTIRDLKNRYNTITENNEKGIIELTRMAIQNCQSRIKHAEVAKVELEEILTDI